MFLPGAAANKRACYAIRDQAGGLFLNRSQIDAAIRMHHCVRSGDQSGQIPGIAAHICGQFAS
jgi:hypothetical protein